MKKSMFNRRGFLLLLSLLLISIGVWIAGAESIINDFNQFPLWVLLGVLVAFALNLVVVSIRLGLLLEYFRVSVPRSVVFKASLQGHFASLFLISLFGQVAGRQEILRRYGVPSVFVASLTAIERGMLFVFSGGLCLWGAAWMLDSKEITAFFDQILFTQMLLAGILAFCASWWFGQSGFETKLLLGFLTKRNLCRLFEISTITITSQMLVLSSFVLAGLGLAPGISFWDLLAAAALTSFAASLPISINGWGIRELVAIFAFGHIGMPPSSALAISILVGFCSTAVVLATFPYVLSRQNTENILEKKECYPPSGHVMGQSLSLEKIAAWGLATLSAILIFFQIHTPLKGGVININLSDGLAILALASVASHSIFSRSPPLWAVPKFNFLLATFGLLLLFAFFHGVQVVGVTQWALAGRLMGWLVLLGYLSVGLIKHLIWVNKA